MIRWDVRSCLKAVRAMPIAGIAQQNIDGAIAQDEFCRLPGKKCPLMHRNRGSGIYTTGTMASAKSD